MNIDSEKFNISTAKTRDMSFTYSNNNSGPTVIAQVAWPIYTLYGSDDCYFDTLYRVAVNRECHRQTDGQTDRTDFSNSAQRADAR